MSRPPCRSERVETPQGPHINFPSRQRQGRKTDRFGTISDLSCGVCSVLTRQPVEKLVGEIAGLSSRGTTSAPPSEAMARPKRLAPVLWPWIIAAFDSLLWPSQPRRARTDATIRTAGACSYPNVLGCSQPAVRGTCSELAGWRNSGQHKELEPCSTSVPSSNRCGRRSAICS